jgi:hypothetical protein
MFFFFFSPSVGFLYPAGPWGGGEGVFLLSHTWVSWHTYLFSFLARELTNRERGRGNFIISFFVGENRSVLEGNSFEKKKKAIRYTIMISRHGIAF